MDTPFFIETNSPYSQRLEIGRYNVVVRAFDKAVNYFQAERRLTIANPIFEIIQERGIRLGGSLLIPWKYAAVIGLVLLLLLASFVYQLWHWHRRFEESLAAGAHTHPAIASKLQELEAKRREYKSGGLKLLWWLLVFVMSGFIFFAPPAQAQTATTTSTADIEPPVITLFPKSLSNDEILYIGGRAGAPNAAVQIYLQNIETGATQTKSALTDKSGAWFYTFPNFLSSGKYIIWTQLRVGEAVSPPSSQMAIEVAPAAFQFGSRRLSYEDLYLILFLAFALTTLLLIAAIIYFNHRYQEKKRRLLREISEAEESIRRGFALLRHDIEAELAIVRKFRMSRELSMEEKLREEKMLKDLDSVSRYLGHEVWEIEQAEKS